jgi:hypothetical protein
MATTRRGRRAADAACGLALLAALLPACVTLHRGGLYDTSRDQVFVGYFYNETFYRDVEFELTEEVVSEILSRPGLRLSSKEDAEVLLSGRVLDVDQRVLSEDKTQVPTSSTTQVTVEVVVTDARTGAVLRQRKLTQRGEFVEARGETIDSGRAVAFRFLARDIVRVLEEDF